MQKKTSTEHQSSDPQLDQLRALILGQDNQRVIDSVEKNARKMVSDVLSEALHDREHKDGSVNTVLQPLVEASVEKSVSHNSKRLVNSLYPLVGSLIRKSVSAFLADFMEKTNELLENSLTYKGLKWRIKAWQAGVSYAQYAASQMFVYRVEYVFLIHRETGLLLKSIDVNHSGKSDGDLISSMLTAINDFVGDSFLANEDGLREQLQSVSTDNFNLLIKPGPSALVVAAVMGKPSQQLNNQLQITLEDIHRLYIDELNSFDGDSLHFEHTENLLRDCLLSEEKNTETHQKKSWFAWLLLCCVTIYAGYCILGWYQDQQLIKKVGQLEHQAGIIINRVSFNEDDKLVIEALRDPAALSINNWLINHDISLARISVKEYSYRSQEPDILLARAEIILSAYPSITSKWQDEKLTLSGAIDLTQYEDLLNKLSIAGFVTGINLISEQINLPSITSPLTNEAIKRQLFDSLVGRISTIQLDFTIASEEIAPEMQLSLQRLYHYLEQLEQLANALNNNYALLVIGSSDSTGIKAANNKLSIKRAENSADFLVNLGLAREKIFITGLGQIDIPQMKSATRKVMFNIIFTQ